MEIFILSKFSIVLAYPQPVPLGRTFAFVFWLNLSNKGKKLGMTAILFSGLQGGTSHRLRDTDYEVKKPTSSRSLRELYTIGTVWSRNVHRIWEGLLSIWGEEILYK